MNKRSFIYLIVVILILWSQGPWHEGDDQGSGDIGLWIILLMVLALTISVLGPRLAQSRWPSISDKDFIEKLEPMTGLPRDALVAERRYVSKVLGVRSTKLRADYQLGDLSKELDFFGSWSVALNDLQDEIEELYEDSSQETPPPPETIGDLVLQLARGRASTFAPDR